MAVSVFPGGDLRIWCESSPKVGALPWFLLLNISTWRFSTVKSRRFQSLLALLVHQRGFMFDAVGLVNMLLQFVLSKKGKKGKRKAKKELNRKTLT